MNCPFPEWGRPPRAGIESSGLLVTGYAAFSGSLVELLASNLVFLLTTSFLACWLAALETPLLIAELLELFYYLCFPFHDYLSACVCVCVSVWPLKSLVASFADEPQHSGH